MAVTEETSTPTKESFIKHYPLASFFILAIGLTWIFMITDALGSRDILPFRLPIPLLIVMGYMPTLAAIIVAGQTEGRKGVQTLLGKLLIWRVGISWYLFAIFGMAAMYIGAIFLYNRFSGLAAVPILSENTPAYNSLLELVPIIAVTFLIAGVVNGEELGWRGFALPHTQAKYNALVSSLIIGVIWAVFHLPLFFTLSGSAQANWSFPNFLITTTAMSILYTWMYNNTRGSVLLAYLFHASANTWTQVFSVDHSNSTMNWIVAGLMVTIAVGVVAVTGVKHLSRKNRRIIE